MAAPTRCTRGPQPSRTISAPLTRTSTPVPTYHRPFHPFASADPQAPLSPLRPHPRPSRGPTRRPARSTCAICGKSQTMRSGRFGSPRTPTRASPMYRISVPRRRRRPLPLSRTSAGCWMPTVSATTARCVPLALHAPVPYTARSHARLGEAAAARCVSHAVWVPSPLRFADLPRDFLARVRAGL